MNLKTEIFGIINKISINVLKQSRHPVPNVLICPTLPTGSPVPRRRQVRRSTLRHSGGDHTQCRYSLATNYGHLYTYTHNFVIYNKKYL